MRVIIPAAGLGRRLSPYTDGCPKCMIPVGGISIIERLLGRLHDAGVTDVVCVVGHHADILERHVTALSRRPPVTFVRNPDYARSDNIVSLLATLPWWNGDIAVFDSDVLISGRAVKELLAAREDAMVIDVNRPVDAIDMAVELKDGSVWHLDKNLPAHRIGGEFFGVSRWTPEGARRLAGAMNEMVAAGIRQTWYPYAIREVAKRSAITPIYVRSDEWLEIDSAEDLRQANAACLAGAAWST